ncbi:Protein p13 MTCP-1 [Myotis brandtii]|uniref:Protein p13 MTCP-1 n=1 Tax=Myotis brandtii TaxID=109478 RepID=S7NDI7_MYOBR|nr:PREDICTED: protein p13 MTCP-1 [Myotis brandtii]EPQ15379.1 Protein p13 MTCP-1 [Myotis brandtii]
MSELRSKVHLTSHPICLRILGPWVYEDENDCTWLYLIIEKEDVLKVLLHQVDIPIEDIALTPSTMTSHTMPLMWTFHPGSQYVDPIGRFWRIVHHIKVHGVEEMILELMKDS